MYCYFAAKLIKIAHIDAKERIKNQKSDKSFINSSICIPYPTEERFKVMTVISGHAPKRKGKEPPKPAET